MTVRDGLTAPYLPILNGEGKNRPGAHPLRGEKGKRGRKEVYFQFKVEKSRRYSIFHCAGYLRRFRSRGEVRGSISIKIHSLLVQPAPGKTISSRHPHLVVHQTASVKGREGEEKATVLHSRSLCFGLLFRPPWPASEQGVKRGPCVSPIWGSVRVLACMLEQVERGGREGGKERGEGNRNISSALRLARLS